MDLLTLTVLVGLMPAPPAVFPKNASTPPTGESLVVWSSAGNAVAWNALIDQLASANIICVGEKHDASTHHALQARVLSALSERIPDLVVGLEMVSQDQQDELDGFLSGRITETDFSTWWDKTWGFPFALYKPIFDAARAKGLTVVGLNAPLPVIKAIAVKGIAGLSGAERAQLPDKIAESSDERYRRFVTDSLSGHGLPPQALARLREAQAAWNETMGANVAALAASGRHVFVVAGNGHMLWRAGVPESASRRGAGPSLVVLPYPLDGAVAPIADLLRLLRDPEELALADAFLLNPTDNP